ncbi:hypothetical protein ACFX10_013076 [Malus domestica]
MEGFQWRCRESEEMLGMEEVREDILNPGAWSCVREEEFSDLVLRGQSVGFESELKLSSNSMESEKEFPKLNQSLYPNIEP